MQNEFDSPDEWDEEEPYYDWDDPDWREDWDDAETTATGGTPVAPAGGAALVAAHCHC
jgi:hypothetical protein